MTRRTSTLLAFALALAFALGACSRSPEAPARKDPSAQLLAHLDRQIEILKSNQDDPAKASRELAAYREKNGAEIEKLKQALADFMQRDPMKAAAVSSVYGMRSSELEYRAAEAAAKSKAP